MLPDLQHDNDDTCGNTAYSFEVTTSQDGYNAGRSYSFRTFVSADERDTWVEFLRTVVRAAVELDRRTNPSISMYARIQWSGKTFSESSTVNVLISTIILSNFVINMLQAEIQPKPGSASERTFKSLDIFFTLIYTTELIFLLIAYGKKFWRDGWKIFDFVVRQKASNALNLTEM